MWGGESCAEGAPIADANGKSGGKMSGSTHKVKGGSGEFLQQLEEKRALKVKAPLL